MPHRQVLQIALPHLLILVKNKNKQKNLRSLNFSYMIPNWHLTLFIRIYIYIYIYLYDEKHFRVAKAWVDDGGFLELLKMVSETGALEGSAVCGVRREGGDAQSGLDGPLGAWVTAYWVFSVNTERQNLII